MVVIDPHAGYAAAVRASLPEARIAVDHFHLIMLANKAVTAVRQRVTQDLLGRRGCNVDPMWANRRLLLRGRERGRTGPGRFTRCGRGPRPTPVMAHPGVRRTTPRPPTAVPANASRPEAEG